MGSADWMPRNLDKRVEILFPVEDENLKKEVISILNLQLSDIKKAHMLMSDGSYKKVKTQGKGISSQAEFCRLAMKRKKEGSDNEKRRVFEPVTKNS